MTDNLLPATIPPAELSAPARQFLPIFDVTMQEEMRAILAANLGPRGLTPQQLDRIKVPTGGAQMFQLTGIEGEEAFKEVSGIALAWIDSRLYYSVPFSERGRQHGPPDCLSKDAFYGIGDPGGECTKCPMAVFGSDPKGGRGQACKEVRRILLLRGEHLLPEMVTVPPTSLINARQYFLRLAGRGVPYWGLITNLRLERASNADGIDFARITFSSGERFSPAECATLSSYQANMMNLLRETDVDADDFSDKGHEEA